MNFDETVMSSLYFHCSYLHKMMLIMKMGLCKENHILFLKICTCLKIWSLQIR